MNKIKPYKILSSRHKVKSSREKNRKFCQNCQEFVLPEMPSSKSHESHTITSNVTNEMMLSPLRKLLNPLELNSSNAVKVLLRN